MQQLIKIHYPNSTWQTNSEEDGDSDIWPFHIILRAFSDFQNTLNILELAFLFGCCKESDYTKIKKGIAGFRKAWGSKPPISKGEALDLFKLHYENIFGDLKKKPGSFYDYAESLAVCLSFTELFTIAGESHKTKISVFAGTESKFNSLLKNYPCISYCSDDSDKYLRWLRTIDNIELPWNNQDVLNEVIQELYSIINGYRSDEKFKDVFGKDSDSLLDGQLRHMMTQLSEKCHSLEGLKELERNSKDFIFNYKKQSFIREASNNNSITDCILKTFKDIDKGIDKAAYLFEINTWKSIVAIEGGQGIQHNFKMDENLGPKSFAPGFVPDLVFRYEQNWVLFEVSLMKGVKQWEHEASSVVDHTISYMDKYPGNKVTCIFIAPSLYPRTSWQFFILNKNSWLDKEVPILPLELDQYVSILTSIYNQKRPFSSFMNLVDDLILLSRGVDRYSVWKDEMNRHISEWCSSHP